MKIETFRMERMQSEYEHDVEYNLSESGVLPLTLGEVLEDEAIPKAMLRSRLGYGEGPGSRELREYIAAWHPGATEANVTVTSGGAEANFTTLWSTIDRLGKASIMLPNYMQTWGIVRTLGRADPFRLRLRNAAGARRWQLDIEELNRSVTQRTRLILVTNPNNPTGSIMTGEEIQAVIAAADRVGAWILSDEIYRGAEVASEEVTGTLWGKYERVIVTGGLSKAFGLPGLRIGWIVAPRQLVRELRRHHDYISIMPSVLSDQLATLVMEPRRRQAVLARTRSILRTNLPPLRAWLDLHQSVFDYVAPVAGAIVFAKARLPVSTRVLVNRLRREQSVLLVAGEDLGAGRGIRFGYGHDIEHTLGGLKRLDRLLATLSTPQIGKGHRLRENLRQQ